MDLNISELDKIMMLQKTAYTSPAPMQMRRGGWLRSFVSYLGGNILTVALGSLFLLGVLIGTLLVSRCGAQTLSVLNKVLGGYASQRETQSFLSLTIATFSSLALPLVLLFFCGFCSIAQPIIALVPLWKGLGYGFSVGAIYAQQGSSSILYVALLLFPAMLLGALLIVVAGRSSLRMSMRLFRVAMSEQEQIGREKTQSYCVKYIAFTVICLLISLLDALVCYKLGGLFVI